MQNKVKVILVLILFTIICCNKSQKHFFKYKNPTSDSIIKINVNSVLKVKENIYKISDTMYLGIQYFEPYLVECETIKMKEKGILLFNCIKYKFKVDLNSYKWDIKNLISHDKNSVYAFPRKYKLSSPKILKLNPRKIEKCDDDDTYIKDDKYVYCIPTDTYLEIESLNFITIKIDGVIYGKDKLKEKFYYFDKQISKR